MSHQYSTGPVAIYVGVGDTVTKKEILDPNTGSKGIVAQYARTVGKKPVFLGTCKRWPVIIIKPEWKPLFTDFSGQVPEDIMFMGEHAYVIAEVNRYSEAVYRSISSRPYYWANRGKAFSSAVGTLMKHEEQTYPIWLVFPYAVKPVYQPAAGLRGAVNFIPAAGFAAAAIRAAAGVVEVLAGSLGAFMPSGYHFLETILEGPDRLDPLGTMARSIHLVFHALPQLKPSSPSGGSERLLYDHDMSALAQKPT